MRLIFLTLFLTAALVSPGGATIPVVDYSSIFHNIVAEVRNYAQYIQQTENGLLQIENQVTMITNQVTSLRRFGDPQFYVNLLNLSAFTATASNLSQGVGQTLGQFRQTANGVMALGYTANGLYSNLTNSVDRFGNRVQYTADSFRKFGAVSQMYESYDGALRAYNGQIASLERQLTETEQKASAASTQMESDKYHTLVDGIHTQTDALGTQTLLKGQQLIIQHYMNQSDAARTQEAQRQQLIQERQADLQHQAANLSTFIDADPGTGN
jgi:Mg2+ and Co2+ transporter CorA